MTLSIMQLAILLRVITLSVEFFIVVLSVLAPFYQYISSPA
jgi:hypothetical protein